MPTITSSHKGNMLFETRIGNHVIINDVPQSPDWGGQDRAPTPPEYFIASLSSCIAAFVVQYGAQSGLNTEGIRVDLHFEKGADPAHLRDLSLEIHLPNAAVGARAEAIKRVCRYCTVHETIRRMGDLEITIRDKTV